jgi:hypothetical protein
MRHLRVALLGCGALDHAAGATDDEVRISALFDTYNCHHVYMDVGSNIGVQMRKLYEPHLYDRPDPRLPDLISYFKSAEIAAQVNASPPVLPVFDQYFGRAPRCHVCSIAVEPNPRHAPRLRELQQSLRAAGAGVLVLTATAADVYDGNTTMWIPPATAQWGGKVNYVGAAVLPPNRTLPKNLLRSSRAASVRTVDLARLLLFVRRELTRRQAGGRIVMKLDTEGAEYRLLPHILARSAACGADLIFLEWHRTTNPKHVEIRQQSVDALAALTCKPTISSIDDETFLYDGVSLPTGSICSSRLPAASSPLPSSPFGVEVQPFAVYWPQWHATPLNDYWFHQGYTDWDLLCGYLHGTDPRNRHRERLVAPLQPPDGLGWYNLTDVAVRRRQAQLAKEFGVYGFAIYHFWFARDPAWGKPASWGTADVGADMDETLLLMLEDGEPDMPFYFIWANEHFVKKWKHTGAGNQSRIAKLGRGAMQVEQTFPESSWRHHFEYLLRFFRHRNYHRIDGRPVFGLHSLNLPPNKMWDLFQQWAQEAGLTGIHILQTFQMNSRPTHNGTVQWRGRQFAPWAHGVQEFGWRSEFGKHRRVPPRHHENWTYGLMTDYDNTARMMKGAALIGKKAKRDGGPPSFERGVEMMLNATVQYAQHRRQKQAMLLIVSWNEWSEQSVLEPSDRWGTQYLKALRRALQHHGQYRYAGAHGLWRTIVQPPTGTAQLTECQHGIPQSQYPLGWLERLPKDMNELKEA